MAPLKVAASVLQHVAQATRPAILSGAHGLCVARAADTVAQASWQAKQPPLACNATVTRWMADPRLVDQNIHLSQRTEMCVAAWSRFIPLVLAPRTTDRVIHAALCTHQLKRALFHRWCSLRLLPGLDIVDFLDGSKVAYACVSHLINRGETEALEPLVCPGFLEAMEQNDMCGGLGVAPTIDEPRYLSARQFEQKTRTGLGTSVWHGARAARANRVPVS